MTPRETTLRTCPGSQLVLGRWLVKEPLDQGVRTTAAVRSGASARALMSWLEGQGVATERLQLFPVDLTLVLGISEGNMPQVREVYNVAGALAFGMTRQDSRRCNVKTAHRMIDFSATLGVQRLVHVSGYRVGRQRPVVAPAHRQGVRPVSRL